MAILDDEVKFSQNMNNEMPKNLSLIKSNCDSSIVTAVAATDQTVHQHSDNKSKKITENILLQSEEFPPSETRIQLSFSVDRLLSDKLQKNQIYAQSAAIHSEGNNQDFFTEKCCDELNSSYACCSLPNCLVTATTTTTSASTDASCKGETCRSREEDLPAAHTLMDFKSIVRPTPVRAMGNNSESVSSLTPFSSLSPTSLLRFHNAQMQQQKQGTPHLPAQSNFTLSALMHPLCSLKPLQVATPQMGLQNFATSAGNRFNTKINFDIPAVRQNLACISTIRHHQHLASASNTNETHIHFNGNTTSTALANTAATNAHTGNGHGHVSSGGKRKRSWSRAVFSNLQRKGLEIQFQQQKYITKPDRRKLAARLNLTDAQVKVWFQNRRMKWRHTRENLKSGQEKQPTDNACTDSLKASTSSSGGSDLPGYSSDGSSSIEMSDVEADDDEIDVVE